MMYHKFLKLNVEAETEGVAEMKSKKQETLNQKPKAGLIALIGAATLFFSLAIPNTGFAVEMDQLEAKVDGKWTEMAAVYDGSDQLKRIAKKFTFNKKKPEILEVFITEHAKAKNAWRFAQIVEFKLKSKKGDKKITEAKRLKDLIAKSDLDSAVKDALTKIIDKLIADGKEIEDIFDDKKLRKALKIRTKKDGDDDTDNEKPDGTPKDDDNADTDDKKAEEQIAKIEALTKKIEELEKKLKKGDKTTGEVEELKNELEDLIAKCKEGNKQEVVGPVPTPPATNPELDALKDELAKMKADRDRLAKNLNELAKNMAEEPEEEEEKNPMDELAKALDDLFPKEDKPKEKGGQPSGGGPSSGGGGQKPEQSPKAAEEDPKDMPQQQQPPAYKPPALADTGAPPRKVGKANVKKLAAGPEAAAADALNKKAKAKSRAQQLASRLQQCSTMQAMPVDPNNRWAVEWKAQQVDMCTQQVQQEAARDSKATRKQAEELNSIAANFERTIKRYVKDPKSAITTDLDTIKESAKGALKKAEAALASAKAAYGGSQSPDEAKQNHGAIQSAQMAVADHQSAIESIAKVESKGTSKAEGEIESAAAAIQQIKSAATELETAADDSDQLSQSAGSMSMQAQNQLAQANATPQGYNTGALSTGSGAAPARFGNSSVPTNTTASKAPVNGTAGDIRGQLGAIMNR